MTSNNNSRAWIVGGTTIIGLGVGLLFLRTSALIFVACLLIGIGVGLVLAQLVTGDKRRD